MATKSKSPTVICNSDTEWQAESDLRTLVEAAKIRKDPKRMAALRAKEKAMRAAMEAATK